MAVMVIHGHDNRQVAALCIPSILAENTRWRKMFATVLIHDQGAAVKIAIKIFMYKGDLKIATKISAQIFPDSA